MKKIRKKHKHAVYKSFEEKKLARHMRRFYKMPLSNYYKMVEEAKGICLICLRPSVLVVDHCHTTGRVRGLLCRRCNSCLPPFEDKDKMERILSYLDSDFDGKLNGSREKQKTCYETQAEYTGEELE